MMRTSKGDRDTRHENAHNQRTTPTKVRNEAGVHCTITRFLVARYWVELTYFGVNLSFLLRHSSISSSHTTASPFHFHTRLYVCTERVGEGGKEKVPGSFPIPDTLGHYRSTTILLPAVPHTFLSHTDTVGLLCSLSITPSSTVCSLCTTN
ncbi:hypothetical protein J6590_105267 [Homalodisca vitripennis]|nr:hypothetical protein J6590_105267 [Homalodisca vitripennis]